MNAHKENSLHFLCPKQNIKMQVWVQNLIGEGASLINKRRQKGLITAGSWQEGARGSTHQAIKHLKHRDKQRKGGG